MRKFILSFVCALALFSACEKIVLKDPSDPSAGKTAPTVTLTDPANNATGVALNHQIATTFSEQMDPTTITSSTFTLTQGSTLITGTVTYSGTNATFTAINDLLPNTIYTATITTGAKDVAGTAMSSNYTFSFTTGAAAVIVLPVINSTDPLNNATGVVFNKPIDVTFSEAMDPTTINASSFTLKQGTTSVTGTISYSGTKATFTPSSNLAPNSIYTGTITTGVKDLIGIALISNYTFSFTTAAAPDITPPTVTSVDPLNNAAGVTLSKTVAVNFSESLSTTTINASTFTLKQGTTAVTGTVSYSGTQATFTPAINLDPSKIYTGTITTGVKDLAGNAMSSNFTFSFTTGSAPDIAPPLVNATDPINYATGVVLTKVIAVTFNEAMTSSSINTSTFILKQGTTAVSGTITYSGTKASFTPSSNLVPNSIYYGTITTGVKDLAGNAMSNVYNFSFTTGAAPDVTPPTAISTDPANGTTGVAFNKVVAVTFSEAMNTSSINTSTFTLKQGTTNISGTVSYSSTTASFTPSSPLAPSTTFTGTITTGAMDVAGNTLSNSYTFSFTTAAALDITPPTINSSDPISNATGIATNKVVAVTFSKAINASTVTTSTFTLKQGTNAITGTVTLSGTTASFTPSAILTAGTVYTATITTGVKDLAGNAFAANTSWSFTTAGTAPPAGLSFATDVVPVLAMCQNCHTHGWTTSSNSATFYTDLVNKSYVVPASYATSKIYSGINNGHYGTGISTANSTKIITWMTQGSKNN